MSDRFKHEFDDDGCCVFCGFDGAEEWHLRSYGRHPSEVERRPDEAIYCSDETQHIRRANGN